LKAALYYAEYLLSIRVIINSCSPEGTLLERAKKAINCSMLVPELMNIKISYKILVPVLDNFEKSIFNIRTR
jgi:hypothetical protein